MKNKHTSKNGVTIAESSYDGTFWKISNNDRANKLICGGVVGDIYLPLWYLRKIKGTDFFNFTFPEGI
jgi:hypothetical protein